MTSKQNNYKYKVRPLQAVYRATWPCCRDFPLTSKTRNPSSRLQTELSLKVPVSPPWSVTQASGLLPALRSSKTNTFLFFDLLTFFFILSQFFNRPKFQPED